MHLRRIFFIFIALVALLASSCGGSSSASSKRTVHVDYNNDDFAGIFIEYFPQSVTVHPGDTIHFTQAWNGEPHSVTMGTLVDRGLGLVTPLLDKFRNDPNPPADAEQQFNDAFKGLPFMTDDDNNVNQAAAQPCYLDRGDLPTDPKTPCPKRQQPEFNGRQSYYSSGFISYAGNNGNTFDVKLAKDIKPGTYGYYCSFHGPEMQGKIVVKPSAAAIPSAAAVTKAAKREADTASAPLRKALRGATTGKFDTVKAAQAAGFPMPPADVLAKVHGAYFAGFGSQEAQAAQTNEFVPRTIRAKVGEKVTWLLIGFHTVSFDVPRYFPILVTEKNGTVRWSKDAADPVGGPGFPLNRPADAPNPYLVDGGTWSGHGFRSSGLTPQSQHNDGEITGFSLTFAKPGTYQYACLIHPKMVGTVVVS